MNGFGLGIRVVLAFVGALAASRAARGGWEPALYAGLIAALTTAEAYVRDPKGVEMDKETSRLLARLAGLSQRLMSSEERSERHLDLVERFSQQQAALDEVVKEEFHLLHQLCSAFLSCDTHVRFEIRSFVAEHR